MAYVGGQDIASVRYLYANVIYQATGRLMNGDDAEDRAVLDDAVMMGDAIASYYSEQDPVFAREWALIVKDRQAANDKVKPGFELEASVLEGFRWRELKAQFRSLCRQGQFVRQESPSAEWIPQGGR